MPASVLIPPDNRLLGWSLSDLTLYGAPVGADVTIGRAAEEAIPLVSPAAGPVANTGSVVAESDRAAADTTALLDRGDAQPPQPSLSPYSPPSVAPVDHANTDAQPSAPQPVGSGSFFQSPFVTPLHAASADHEGGGGQGGTGSGGPAGRPTV